VRLSSRLEANRRVEGDGLRIGHHVDSRRATLAGYSLRVFHEAAPNARAHPIRLDEQAIELAGTRRALKQHGKADDHAALLSDSDKTRRDLLRGQLDGVRMSLKLGPVHRLVHRGAPLELFQRVAF
jgi:hypothetical protein